MYRSEFFTDIFLSIIHIILNEKHQNWWPTAWMLIIYLYSQHGEFIFYIIYCPSGFLKFKTWTVKRGYQNIKLVEWFINLLFTVDWSSQFKCWLLWYLNNQIAPIAYIYNNMQSVTISHWNCFTWVDLKFTIKWLYFDLLYIHNQLILRCLFYNNVLTVLECDDALVYCPFLRILSRGYML